MQAMADGPDIPTALAKLAASAESGVPNGMDAANASLLAVATLAARVGDAVTAARVGAQVVFCDLARIAQEAAGDRKAELEMLKIAERRQRIHNMAVKNLQAAVDREQRLLERPSRAAPPPTTTVQVQVNNAPEPAPQHPRVASWLEKTNELRLQAKTQ